MSPEDYIENTLKYETQVKKLDEENQILRAERDGFRELIEERHRQEEKEPPEPLFIVLRDPAPDLDDF